MNLEALAAFYASLNFIATLLLIILCVYIIWRQGIAHTESFIILLLAAVLLTLVNGLMMVGKSPEVAGFWDNFRWLALAFIPPLLLIFILDFTGRSQRLSSKWLFIYFAIPLLTQIFVWTNDQHHLTILSRVAVFPDWTLSPHWRTGLWHLVLDLCYLGLFPDIGFTLYSGPGYFYNTSIRMAAIHMAFCRIFHPDCIQLDRYFSIN